MKTEANKNYCAGGTVLVAEDTNLMRSACRRALERAGHRVILASDGVEAMAISMSEDIDAALLDIKMPGPSGLDVLKKIKENKPSVEVIVMTAYATREMTEEATRLGASGFLTKPLADPGVLSDAVGQAVARKKFKEEGKHGLARIEELLVKEKVITEKQLNDAREKAARRNVPAREILIESGVVRAEDFDRVLAKALDIPFARLCEKDVDPAAARRLPACVARSRRMIPILIEGNNIHIALDDPFDSDGLDMVERKTGLKPVVVKGFGPEIDALLKRFYPEGGSDLEAKIAAFAAAADPKKLSDIFGTARILKLDKAEFDKRIFQGETELGRRKSWVFRVEGIIADDADEED